MRFTCAIHLDEKRNIFSSYFLLFLYHIVDSFSWYLRDPDNGSGNEISRQKCIRISFHFH